MRKRSVFNGKELRNIPRGRTAFTLTETLLVVTLLSLIGLSLYQALANGINIWRRSMTQTVDEDVGVFLDALTRDLHAAVIYSRIPYELDATRFAFAAVIRTREDRVKAPGGTTYVDQIGRVEYFFDKSKSSVFRREANYGQALSDKFSPPRCMVTEVQAFSLDYAYAARIKSDVPEGEEGFMPAAVKVTMEIREPDGRIRTIRRLIDIPIATIL